MQGRERLQLVIDCGRWPRLEDEPPLLRYGQVSGLSVATGAEVSVLCSSHQDCHSLGTATLRAANGYRIAACILHSLNIKIRLRRTFRWVFIIANVNHPILGSDFLQDFNLDIGVLCRSMVYSSTTLAIQSASSPWTTTSISKIDLVKAYHQSPVGSEGILKTAVITPYRLFLYICMPLGLQNAAQTFQRFVGNTTRGLSFVYAYVDDLFVASAMPEEHCQQLWWLFSHLDAFRLVPSIKKCIFRVSTRELLGHTIALDGIQSLPFKVHVIRGFPKPLLLHKLREFLALLNFHRRFIPLYANQSPLRANPDTGCCCYICVSRERSHWCRPFESSIPQCSLPLTSWLTLRTYLLEQLISSKLHRGGGTLIHFSLRNSIQQKPVMLPLEGSSSISMLLWSASLFPERSHLSHSNGSDASNLCFPQK